MKSDTTLVVKGTVQKRAITNDNCRYVAIQIRHPRNLSYNMYVPDEMSDLVAGDRVNVKIERTFSVVQKAKN